MTFGKGRKINWVSVRPRRLQIRTALTVENRWVFNPVYFRFSPTFIHFGYPPNFRAATARKKRKEMHLGRTDRDNSCWLMATALLRGVWPVLRL